MASVVLSGRFSDHVLAWALAFSLLLHLALLMLLQPSRAPAPVPQAPLKVVLQPPKPEPPPEVSPPKEPPKAPPPAQKRLPKPAPAEKPQTSVVESPTTDRLPLPPPPEVIAVEPKPEQKVVFVAPPPPPEPPKPQGPTAQDIEAARNGYGSLLAREFAKHKQYPRQAQARGWQGTTRVQLELDAAGNVLSTTVSVSSGHEILDQQALEMVKKVSPLPLPPDILRNQPLTILVPIPFRLE